MNTPRKRSRSRSSSSMDISPDYKNVTGRTNSRKKQMKKIKDASAADYFNSVINGKGGSKRSRRKYK